MVWQRPQRLLPPRLLDALEAVHAGDVGRALKLAGSGDSADALTAETVRLVRGLAAAESGEAERAARLLRPLRSADDADIALAATLASVELQLQRRGFARAAPWLRRARRQAQDGATALVLDAAASRLRLLRGEAVPSAEVAQLEQRLQRRHPAAVHATVHLLASEHGLYAGALGISTRAERTARPYVAAARLASLRRWHAALEALLRGAPVALVEDWKRPRRSMTRAELADLESESWQMWVDCRQRKVLVRSGKGTGAQSVCFAAEAGLWGVLVALLESARKRLDWAQVAAAAGGAASAGRDLAVCLQEHLALAGAGRFLRLSSALCTLAASRFVVLQAPRGLHRLESELLAQLAAKPGQRGDDLARALGAPLRTVQRHLQALRHSGLAHMAGGGPQARHWAL